MNTKALDVLRTAKVCEHCKEVMPAGTPIRWAAVTFTAHRSYSGRAYEKQRRVPVHAHDCVQARIDAVYAERAAKARDGRAT